MKSLRVAFFHTGHVLSKNSISSEKVLRFDKSEIWVHWAIAVPFIICYASALVLVFHYNPDPSRPFRNLCSMIHQSSGIALLLFPMIVMIKHRRTLRVYFNNIRHSLDWTIDDLKWLLLKGVASIGKKVSLPEQGKFNAAEKVNFMILVATYPVYIVTGIIILMTDSFLLPWIIHIILTVIATPLMFGHVFMATINPTTRVALPGMFSGFVDREYVKHHHSLWYRDHFKDTKDSAPTKTPPPKTNSIEVQVQKS